MKRAEKLPDNLVYDKIDSPVGELMILASTEGLQCILWDVERRDKEAIKRFKNSSNNKIIIKVKKQLSEYFSGKRKTFDLPLIMEGTEFQKQAWQQLCKIPYGQTISYGEQAKRVGDKNKARAVGMANGKNPIPIIVPCHRVIGSNGTLTGFAGGVDRKAILLDLEKRH